MSEKLGWRIFWSIVVLLGLASIGLTITAYATPVPENSSAMLEAAKMFFLCLGGSGVILSTYFSAVSIYFSSKNIILQRKLNIIENTFELLSRWDDPHYLDARKWTRKAKEEKPDTSDNDLINKIKENEELKQSVVLVLNYLEHVRFSLETNRIDRKLFKRALGETLVDIAKRFEPYAKTLSQQNIEDLKELIGYLEKD